MADCEVPIDKSISTQLLKTVFSFYLVLAVSVTLVHMSVEYRHTKQNIIKELHIIQKTYNASLAKALWDMNLSQLKSTFLGMVQLPAIEGVKLENHRGEEIGASGMILDKDDIVVKAEAGKAKTIMKGYTGLFFYSFPIVYKRIGKEVKVGEATLYSSRGVVFDKVKLGFMFIVINSIIKTIGLWFIFIWIFDRLLGRPLADLTHATGQIQLDRLEKIKINLRTKSRNELVVLEDSFNTMIQKLLEAKAELIDYAQELEYRVNERTDELSEANARLRKAKQSAENANVAKSLFLANMSHELRTPLNAILGFSQLISQDHTIAPEHKEHLSIILRSGEHLLSLINDVLDMSKIEAGRITLNEKNFNLHGLLNDLKDMMHLRAENKSLSLSIEKKTDVPQYVRTDEIKLRQILVNLIGNAIKFTREGGVKVRVETCSSAPRRLYFKIEDTGPGIAPEDSSVLFDPFVQTKTGRQTQEGTGLGLAITRKFVQLMGGDIRMHSEVGQGALFTFDILFHPADAGTVEDPPVFRNVIGVKPGQMRHKILIVDDNPDSRKLLYQIHKPFGFELREAENGLEAVEIWREWMPDLIWMDIRMPVMNGYEAVKTIRKNSRKDSKRPESIIIAQTAASLEDDRETVLEAGCNDFLRKPFKEPDIVGMIHKHLGVQFIYEKDVKTHHITPAVNWEALLSLPDEWLDNLKRGAEQVDFFLILNVIEQIRERDPTLADALTRLAENFDYDLILDLISGETAVDGD